MSDISDFLGAMQMLQKGMQDVATQSAISDATTQMQQNSLAIKDQWERSQANQALANKLAMTLTATGANPSQVAQASKAAMGQQFATPEDAMFAGVMGGDKKLANEGLSAQRLINKDANWFKQQQLDIDKLSAMFQGMKVMKEHQTFNPAAHNWADISANLEALPEDVRKRVIPGVGVVANEKNLDKVQEPLLTVNQASNKVDSILSRINDGQLDLTNRALIDQEATMLAMSLKKDIVGPGNLSDGERAVLKDVAGNPTAIANLIMGRDTAKIQNIKSIFQKSLDSAYKTYAITPFKDTGSGMGGASSATAGDAQRMQHMKALADFVRQNPNDPRATQALKILQANGIKVQ